MELPGQPVSVLPQSWSLPQSQLATTCGQFETVCIPGSCCPVKVSRRKKTEDPGSVCTGEHAHTRAQCDNCESSAQTGVCGRGLTGQAAPAMRLSQTSGLFSFPRSKIPQRPLSPSRPCKVDSKC